MRDHDGFHGTVLAPIGAILVILGLALLLACTSGCGALMVGNYGSNTLEVVNSSTHDLTISVNGRLMEFKFGDGHQSQIVPPGESVRLKYSRTMAIVAKFYDHGHFVGVATHKRYASDNYYGGYTSRDADVWVVKDSDMGQTGTTGGLFGW